MFDREIIFRWIFEKRWNELIEFVHKNPEADSSDPVLQSGLETFVHQLVAEIENGSKNEDFAWYLEKAVMLAKLRKIKMSPQEHRAIVVELVKQKQSNLKVAYSFAILYPDEATCASTIRRYEASIPKAVAHSQAKQISVTENAVTPDVDHTISLFKSQQEHDFYRAVVEVFPNYSVYPNVALSCLINFRAVEQQLTPEEKRFFYSAIVDCVVFDIFKGHKPVRFFELDSIYHDSPEQIAKDRMKDRILSLAGQKLYRVRKVSGQVNQAEFVRLIGEVL